MTDIPYGYCHCGCGQKTKIASRTHTRYGWIKGQPMRFVVRHKSSGISHVDFDDPNPSGLCMCGCGKPTVLAVSSCGAVKHAVFAKAHPIKSKKELFWSYVKTGTPDECWEWRLDRNAAGYGRFNNGSKIVLAHRYAYEISVGQLSDGTIVCHKCDNPPCCNPKHLFSGTYLDNNLDAIQKGRARKAVGEGASRSKLTEDQVRHILSVGKERTHKDVAKQFGVSKSTISAILLRHTWKHITI